MALRTFFAGRFAGLASAVPFGKLVHGLRQGGNGFLVCLFLLSSAGCSTFWSFEHMNEGNSAGRPAVPKPVELSRQDTEPDAEVASVDSVAKAPILLEVAQTFFEEEDLRIKVRLTSRTTLNAENVIVSVVGLEEGEVVEQEVQRISTVLGRSEIGSGETVLVDFTLPGEGLTEYQIRGSWGDHAAKALLAERVSRRALPEELEESPDEVHFSEAGPGMPFTDESISEEPAARARLAASIDAPQRVEAEPTQSSGMGSKRVLTLENVELKAEPSDCSEPPCSLLYTIRAELVNHEIDTLGDIGLAVGLYWANAGQLPQIPEHLAPLTDNEEEIPLGRLLLHPAARKKIRIAVDREVPQVPGGEFIPHLRIVRYRPLIPEPLGE